MTREWLVSLDQQDKTDSPDPRGHLDMVGSQENMAATDPREHEERREKKERRPSLEYP